MAISKYIFSLLLIINTFVSFAQDEELYVQEKPKDTLRFYGFKLGVNIWRFADFQFKPERFSYEASFDFNIGHKYFGVIEGGHSEINLDKENFNYTSNGNFLKLGLDYNMLKKQPTDFLGAGLRFGWTGFKHSADQVSINDEHWGSYSTAISEKKYTMYWLEVSMGIKGEIFKNIYLGWAAIAKVRVSGGKDALFQPYDIPGFGNGKNSINLGINYYIYYQIPFNRK